MRFSGDNDSVEDDWSCQEFRAQMRMALGEGAYLRQGETFPHVCLAPVQNQRPYELV